MTRPDPNFNIPFPDGTAEAMFAGRMSLEAYPDGYPDGDRLRWPFAHGVRCGLDAQRRTHADLDRGRREECERLSAKLTDAKAALDMAAAELTAAKQVEDERDKLLGFYTEIVKALGHDRALQEIARLTKERDEFQRELQKVCDHEWTHQDDSFDHEFGTEQLHSCLCEKCGATKPYEPETFGDEAI